MTLIGDVVSTRLIGRDHVGGLSPLVTSVATPWWLRGHSLLCASGAACRVRPCTGRRLVYGLLVVSPAPLLLASLSYDGLICIWNGNVGGVVWHPCCRTTFLLVYGRFAHGRHCTWRLCLYTSLRHAWLSCVVCGSVGALRSALVTLVADVTHRRHCRPYAHIWGSLFLYFVALVGLPPVWGFSHRLACTLVRVS